MKKPPASTLTKSAQPAASKPTRRAFLVWGGFSGGSVLASVVANQFPPVEWGRLVRQFNKASTRGVNLALCTDLSARPVKFHHGHDHYLNNSTHPDNVGTGDQITALVASATGLQLSDDPARYSMEPESDWVLVGAPSSNALSGMLLASLGKPGMLSPTSLRFQYRYEDTLVPLRRFTAAKIEQAQAKRSEILDVTTGRSYRPEEGGTQTEDYLLVTRLPPQGHVGSRTIIGGTHGIGTRAIVNLLNEAPFTDRQARELERGKYTGYQLLAKVDVETGAHETVVRGLTVLDVVSL